MHHQQVGTNWIRNKVRERQRREIVNTRLPDIFRRPGDRCAFLHAFFGCLIDDLDIYIALHNRTVQPLNHFQYLFWAWAVQTQVAGDDKLVYWRLLCQIL